MKLTPLQEKLFIICLNYDDNEDEEFFVKMTVESALIIAKAQKEDWNQVANGSFVRKLSLFDQAYLNKVALTKLSQEYERIIEAIDKFDKVMRANVG